MTDNKIITFLAVVNLEFTINIEIIISNKVINIARMPMCKYRFFKITAAGSEVQKPMKNCLGLMPICCLISKKNR